MPQISVGGTSSARSACRCKHEVDARILARFDERGQRRVDHMHVALVLLELRVRVAYFRA